MNTIPILTVVVPCYNEAEVLAETTDRLTAVLNELIMTNQIHSKSKILYIDDGSKDSTWSIISKYSRFHPYVTGLKLSRNFGHQHALLAGLEAASEYSHCVVSIDADLQDDVNIIKVFVAKYLEGYDIVYGVRDKRNTDTFFKRNTALFFYHLMGKLGVQLVPNHADFRLMSRRALKELMKYQEENLFIRGIIPLLGFKTAKVYYDRKERFAGESKYPLKKMVSFALDGITSFTTVPIRLLTYFGAFVIFIDMLTGIFTLFRKFEGVTVPGWTSLMISVWFFGGVQLIATGVIGEYIGKIFKETKHRPRYTVESNLYSKKESNYFSLPMNNNLQIKRVQQEE